MIVANILCLQPHLPVVSPDTFTGEEMVASPWHQHMPIAMPQPAHGNMSLNLSEAQQCHQQQFSNAHGPCTMLMQRQMKDIHTTASPSSVIKRMSRFRRCRAKERTNVRFQTVWRLPFVLVCLFGMVWVDTAG